MYGKLFCVLLLAAAMLIRDIPNFKQASHRDRVVYGVMMVPLLYLAFLFVASKPWPNLDTLFNLLTGPADRFVHWLNPAKS
ncbi:hypothetical protein EBB07_13740 [Paenibacillaceae bacterium]|nr:hypothetical protein EBB07_13740 [Paenibacillaceae bacterium]